MQRLSFGQLLKHIGCVCVVIQISNYLIFNIWKALKSYFFYYEMPSVFWHCWLGSKKGIWPVKNWVVDAGMVILYGARCRFAYGPAYATATDCLLLQ